LGLEDKYIAEMGVPFGKRSHFTTEARPPVQAVPEVVEWTLNPVTYLVKGVPTEFFTIGHLSRALGRANVTIRGWEKTGKLPKSPYRAPVPKRSTVNGPPKGKRLWTRQQIEGILRIAEEEQCIVDPDQSPPTPRFTSRVTHLFNQILQSES